LDGTILKGAEKNAGTDDSGICAGAVEFTAYW
jgi:hypothetical protein